MLSEHGTVISTLREVFEDVEKAPFNVRMSSFIVFNSVLIVDSMEFSLLSMPDFHVAKLNFSESMSFLM